VLQLTAGESFLALADDRRRWLLDLRPLRAIIETPARSDRKEGIGPGNSAGDELFGLHHGGQCTREKGRERGGQQRLHAQIWDRANLPAGGQVDLAQGAVDRECE
jgi:hypothetical protein